MPYVDPSLSFEIPMPQGTCIVEYPFMREGDRDSFLVTQTVIQPNNLYRPETPGLSFDESRINADNVLLPDGISDAFLIEESDPTVIGNGYLAWNQVWGIVPQPRVDPVLLSWVRPGIETVTAGATATITGYGVGQRPVGLNQAAFIDVDDANGFSPGDLVVFMIFVPSTFQPGRFTVQQARTRILEISGTRFFIETTGGVYLFFDPQFSTNLTFNPVRNTINRPAKAVSILGWEQVEYQILESADQYMPTQPFVVLDSTGAETDIVTSTTTPTDAAYLSYIATGEGLQAASVEMSRWRGNIYEIRTPFVRAQ